MTVSVDDLIARWRPLTTEEIDKAAVFIADAENYLHVYAHDRGYDLDEMLENPPERADLYTAVICDVVKREMISSTDDSPALSQSSLAVNGYSVSGTYLTPGGGLFIKNSELKLLGLHHQISRAVNLYVE